ncbi:hypothetical protein D3C85_1801920 [compost metagenome]|jgi:hypothetical protein
MRYLAMCIMLISISGCSSTPTQECGYARQALVIFVDSLVFSTNEMGRVARDAAKCSL